MNEQILEKFDRAFMADPSEALHAVDDMAKSLMQEIEQKRKAGVQELDPGMVKLQEDHAYLSGLHEAKAEELAMHQRLHKQAGVEIDSTFQKLIDEAPAVFNEFDILEDDDLMTKEEIELLAKKVNKNQASFSQEPEQGIDIASFEPEPDLSELDRFTMRRAEEPIPVKKDTSELDGYSKRHANNSFMSNIKKKVQERFSASSHAPVNFVPESEIKKMFGNTIKSIEEQERTRKIIFTDSSYMTESAQGLSIVSEDRNVAAKRLTMMAVAKGWNSITFEGNQLFLEQAYEEATKAGLVVKPTSEEQAKLFKEVHEYRKMDSIMPFGGKKEGNKKDIDKEIENPGYGQSAVPVQAPIYNARLPTGMK
ncbi:hypothetical protein LLS47_23725 [Rouxiella badensis]|uniref:LPD7 domain-containing protein n=1 Tax=Rouxiella badensis TaxID=1646377 RepID=UPI001D1437B5|nr:LPD7 domain-containing protein [Rouxiella badensis]MCC3735913.1 hypothetical protein [Rouxiella badensis]MCC3761310.1 hypothetical protein [Rouxiella badensis]